VEEAAEDLKRWWIFIGVLLYLSPRIPVEIQRNGVDDDDNDVRLKLRQREPACAVRVANLVSAMVDIVV